MSSDERRAQALANVLPSVRALKPYTLKAVEAPIKLNQNESPWDLPEPMRRAIVEATLARPWNRYPDFVPTDVLDGLGRLHGLTGANIALGNGSNELIQAVFAAIVARGRRVALPVPTFTLYAMMIAANEGEVVPVPLREDLSYDLDAYRALARAGDADLLLCTPNNPTGSSVDPAFVDELAAMTPRMVVVDEAYVQFGKGECASLVARHPNLIVLRTFSKALGLAGVRLGYAVADAALIPEIGKVKLPYNVGVFGLEVARAFLASPEVVEPMVERILAERTRLETALEALPLDRVWRGAANFVLVRLPGPVAPVFDAMYAEHVLVRDVSSYPMLDRCVRISVGTPDENDRLIAALARALGVEPPRTGAAHA